MRHRIKKRRQGSHGDHYLVSSPLPGMSITLKKIRQPFIQQVLVNWLLCAFLTLEELIIKVSI